MKRISFRTRSAIIISLTFIVLLSTFFALSYVAVHATLVEQGDKEIREQLRLILSKLRPASSPAEISTLVLGYGSTGEAVLGIKIYNKTTRTYLPASGPHVEEQLLDHIAFPPGSDHVVVETDSTTYRCFRTSNELYEVSAAMNTRVLDETGEAMSSAYSLLLLFGSLASYGIGYLVAGYSLRPFHRLVEAARRIQAEPSTSARRLPLAERTAEINELAQAINSILDARDRSIARLSAFSADVAHELRTPLTAMKGELEVELKIRPASDSDHQLLESLLEETDRLIAIVADLLLLSELEQEVKSGSATESATCDLAVVLHGLAERSNRIAAAKQLALKVDNVAGNITLAMTAVRLERMLFNVILNAINYTAPAGEIRVKIFEEPSQVIIEVVDTGKGIAQEDLTHIFDRFWRAEQSRSRSYGGAGLGLAITRSIAERSGIALSIESEVGKGTCVRFTIPASLIAS